LINFLVFGKYSLSGKEAISDFFLKLKKLFQSNLEQVLWAK